MQRTIKLSLDESGPKELATRLNRFAGALTTNIPRDVGNTLGMIGADAVRDNLSKIPKYDGNDPGDVFVEKIPMGVRIVNQGPQVGFLEFGTGARGAASPHPMLGQAGIQLSGRIQWIFFDKLKGGIRTSRGLPPQGQVLNAARTVRRAAPTVMKNEIRRAVNAL